MTLLRRVKTLEKSHNSEYGEPFQVFMYKIDGTLTNWETGELVTCEDSPPTAFSVFRNLDGEEIHITHNYAVVLRDGLSP